MRCVSYQFTATALLGSQRGNPVVVGDTVMLSPGRFTITDVSIGANRDLINVTYMKNESNCPGYPTEWFTVDVDGVQVVKMTANQVQSQAINHANGSVTLSLPLNQPLPENAVTLNMTKYNAVPTNRSDDTGNIVTEMMTWGTSAVFDLSQESSAATNDKGEASVGGVVGAIISVTTVVVVITIAVALVIARKRKANVCGTFDLKATSDVLGGIGGTPPSPAKTDVTILSDFGTKDPHKNVVSDDVVEPPPSPAAGTADKTLEVGEPEEECHSVTESTKDSSGQVDPHSRPRPSYPLESAIVHTPSKTSGEPKSCNGREERPTVEKKRKLMDELYLAVVPECADMGMALEDDHETPTYSPQAEEGV